MQQHAPDLARRSSRRAGSARSPRSSRRGDRPAARRARRRAARAARARRPRPAARSRRRARTRPPRTRPRRWPRRRRPGSARPCPPTRAASPSSAANVAGVARPCASAAGRSRRDRATTSRSFASAAARRRSAGLGLVADRRFRARGRGPRSPGAGPPPPAARPPSAARPCRRSCRARAAPRSARLEDRRAAALLLRQLLQDLREARRVVLLAHALCAPPRRSRPGPPPAGRSSAASSARACLNASRRPPRAALVPGLERLGHEAARGLRAEQPRDVELDEPPRREERAIQQRVRHRLRGRVVLEAEDLGVLAAERLARAADRLLDEELHVADDQDGRRARRRTSGLPSRRTRPSPCRASLPTKKAPVGETDGGHVSKGTVKADDQSWSMPFSWSSWQSRQ